MKKEGLNRKEAASFAVWYSENKAHLKKILLRNYVFDEDVLSDIFLSIYCRILYKGVIIKDYMPYTLRAFKYGYLTRRKKACRLVLVEDYNQLKTTYSYEDSAIEIW
jgi:hypothetical protein